MKHISIFIIIFLLTACSTPQKTTPLTTAPTSILIDYTPTFPPPTRSSILQLNSIEEAPGATFEFDNGIPKMEQEVVHRSVSYAYSLVASHVGGQSIPATIYVYSSCEGLETAFQEYLKRTNEQPVTESACIGFFAQREGVFILASARTPEDKMDELASFVFHEYFHIVQYYLAGNPEPVNGRIMPVWAMEGSAEYFKLMALEWLGSEIAEESWEWRDQNLRLSQKIDIANMETSYDQNHVYGIGSEVVRFLVDQYGFDKLMLFFKNINKTGNWETAFDETYQTTPDLFYSKFNEYKDLEFAYITPTPTKSVGLGSLGGRLTFAGGDPVAGAVVIACEIDPKVDCPRTRTDENGRFTLKVPKGSWAIGIMFNGETWSGFYKKNVSTGYTAQQLSATWVPVKEGENVGGINIIFPDESVWDRTPPCSLVYQESSNQFAISGTLSSASGTSINGYEITACPIVDGRCKGGYVSSSGLFSINVPNGGYVLGVNVPNAPDNSPPMGWYVPNGISKDQLCRGVILVNGSDVRDIQIVIP